tara:strand:+ start:171 stop:374 length:204 start_codon:yes stop_codon:yes gene_type:complete
MGTRMYKIKGMVLEFNIIAIENPNSKAIPPEVGVSTTCKPLLVGIAFIMGFSTRITHRIKVKRKDSK